MNHYTWHKRRDVIGFADPISRNKRGHVLQMIYSTTPSSLPILLLAFIFYLNFISRIILAPMLPEITADLSLSHAEGGSFFLCISCGYFVSLLGSGFFSSRLGHKRTIIISLLATGQAMLLASLSSSLLLLQMSFLFLGWAAGLYLPSAVATITSLYQAKLLGRVFGVHEVAPNLAFLTAPLFAAWLSTEFTWQQVLLLLAIITSAAAILYGIYGHGRHLQGTAPDLASCRELISLREFWLLVVLFSMGIGSTHGVYSVLPTFLISEHAMDEAAANTLVGLSRSTTLLTAFFGGWLSDKFGSHRTISVILLVTGVFTVLLGISAEPLLAVWIWLQPLTAVCFFAPAFSALSQIGSPGARNMVVSLALPIAFVFGAGVVPVAITTLADGGHFSLGLILSGVFIGSGSLLGRVLKD